MVDGEGADGFFDFNDLREGHLVACCRGDIELGEDGWVSVEAGQGFYEHIVLVNEAVDLRDFIV